MNIKFRFADPDNCAIDLKSFYKSRLSKRLYFDNFFSKDGLIISDIKYAFEDSEVKKRIKIGEINLNHQLYSDDRTLKYFLDIDINITNCSFDWDDLDNDINAELEDFKFSIVKFFTKSKNSKCYKTCFVFEDFQTKKINCKLSSLVYDLENRFREIIDNTLSIEVSPNWSEQFNERYSFKKKHDAYFKDIKNYTGINVALFSLLTDQLYEIISPKKYALSEKITDSKFVESELSEILWKMLDKNITSESIFQRLRESKLFDEDKESYLDQFFSRIYSSQGDRMFQKKWEEFTKARNHIAHNKPLDLDFYKKNIQLFEEIMSEFNDFLEKYEFTKEIKNMSAEISLENFSNEFQTEIIGDMFQSEEVVESSILQIGEAEECELESSFDSEEIFELESGVEVRNEEEILQFFADIINEKVDELFNSIRENEGEVNINNSFANNLVLLKAEHPYIVDKMIEINVDNILIDDSRGGQSKAVISFDIGNEEQEYVELKYMNGDYSYNESQGNYMPITQDELDSRDFISKVDELINNIDSVMPNLLEQARNEATNYYHATDGGEPVLIEGECPNCWSFETLTMKEEFFELAGKDWEEGTGLCLECGEYCTIGENAQGYTTIVSYGSDPYYENLILDND